MLYLYSKMLANTTHMHTTKEIYNDVSFSLERPQPKKEAKVNQEHVYPFFIFMTFSMFITHYLHLDK
jgi:hypothetical protein